MVAGGYSISLTSTSGRGTYNVKKDAYATCYLYDLHVAQAMLHKEQRYTTMQPLPTHHQDSMTLHRMQASKKALDSVVKEVGTFPSAS